MIIDKFAPMFDKVTLLPKFITDGTAVLTKMLSHIPGYSDSQMLFNNVGAGDIGAGFTGLIVMVAVGSVITLVMSSETVKSYLKNNPIASDLSGLVVIALGVITLMLIL
jgi:hypothetical protein